MTEKGVTELTKAFQYGGGAFFSYGWCPRPLEGFDHLFFYALEHRTGKHFIHGYPVALGTYLGSKLQNNRPEFILDVLLKCGIDIRPEAMGVTWKDVVDTLQNLADFVKENDYMFTIASMQAHYSQEWLEDTKSELYNTFKQLD